jgi:hypothetical protein
MNGVIHSGTLGVQHGVRDGGALTDPCALGCGMVDRRVPMTLAPFSLVGCQ